MNKWNRDDDRTQQSDDNPPYSRIFIVCAKQTTVDDLRKPFEAYGEIEDIYMPYDKRTEANKGVAFIKYAKTTSAAAAIEALHQKVLPTTGKTIKVMIAVSKNADPHNDNEFKYKRLFIKVAKSATKDELIDYFSKFGQVQSVHLVIDKNTSECKGFAYVLYQSFLDAARAFEGCDQKYKPVFATPREELKRGRYHNEEMFSSSSSFGRDRDQFQYSHFQPMKNESYGYQAATNFAPKIPTRPDGYNNILVCCQPSIPERCIQRLFNVIPGMQKFQYSYDSYNNSCKATIAYENEQSAAHAVECLNDYEFPSGEILLVEPYTNPLKKAASDLHSIVNNFNSTFDNGNPDIAQLVNVIAQASSLIKVATENKGNGQGQGDNYTNDFCNVKLPSPKPLAPHTASVVKRCFIVAKPQPPPIGVLKDIFCRFGDLIDISILPKKNYGYVKYASEIAANDAIKTLHGAVVTGMYLKVMVADEKKPKDQTEYNGVESKRMRFDEQSNDLKD